MISVLIADDHGVLRDGLQRLLEADAGIQVVATAGDGREAVAKAAEWRPQVVVMDVSMPHLGGIDATRTILGSAPATGVVMLSMHSSQDTIRLALQAGARGYLLKDSAGEEVVNAVLTVAAGGSYLGDGVLPSNETMAHGNRLDSPLARLTATERDILRLVADGRSNAEAARVLGLSPRTVETYRARLMEKLQVQDLPSLVKIAIRHGLTSVD